MPTTRTLSRHGLERMWSAQAMLNASRDTVRYFTKDEDSVYIQSSAGIVTSFNAETGERRWAVLLGRPDGSSLPLASNDDMVMVTADMTLYALDKWSGDLQWQLRLPTSPSAGPGVDKNRVYLGMLDGSVYAYDLRKIRERFAKGLLPQMSFQTVDWRFQGFGPVTSPPISTGSTVSFASRGGSLYSVSAESGKRIFQFETDDPITAPIVRSNEMIFIASEDFGFYAIRADNGRVQWEFVSGFAIRNQPYLVSNDVYILPDRGGIFRRDAKTGKQHWWQPMPRQFLAATKENVYTYDEFDNLVILNRSNGVIQGALPLRGFSVPLSNTRTDRIFVATPDGLVLAMRENDREFPVYHLHPELLPILPEFAPEQAAETQGEQPLPAEADAN